MKRTLFLMALIALTAVSFAQTTFYSEAIGTVASTTQIATHETNNGFDVDSATYSGTADIRITQPSTGYTGASGLANVYFTTAVGRYFLAADINTSAYSNITMSFGHYMNTTTAGSDLTLEVSSDGTNWTTLTYTRPATAAWVLITPSGSIPSTTNLRIRFTRTLAVAQLRIDDIKLYGTSNNPTISLSTLTLTGFNYAHGSGPSPEQSYTVSGSYLTDNIYLTAPSHYQISLTSGSGYTNSLTLYRSGSNVPTTPIYVILSLYLDEGYFTFENISHTSSGALTQNLACSGYVYPEPPVAGVQFDFEGTGEEKISYASGTVSLSDYDFNMTQAMIGTASEDMKFQSKAARLRYDGTTYGSITMLQPKTTGIGAISFYYARSNFSGDRTGIAPGFVVDYSTDATNWLQAGTVTDLSGIDTPTLFSVTVNVGGSVYFRIRQLLGDSGKRWNVDNIQLSDYEDTNPVELSSFTATLSAQNFINLTWVTQSETGMSGYYIYRGIANEVNSAEMVSPLIPATNTTQQQSYIYTDSDIDNDGTYYYWLQSIEMDGAGDFHGPISVYYNTSGGDPTPEIPVVTELKDIYPNPFNPLAFIPFSVATTTNVSIVIYNSRGQMVKNIDLGSRTPGNYRIEWNGTDYNGNALSNGVYCIKMLAGKDSFQQKAVLMK
jgi:hypothetical protein